MSQKLLFNATFHSLLTKIDQELAEKARQEGCPACGGHLHLAEYPRSPIGMPSPFRKCYERRFSFCCSHCRKRTTPQTVRFFGRRWFPAPLLILISALLLGINERRLTQVKRHFGIIVSEATWKRWRRWWRDLFEVTPFWQQAKGLVTIPIKINNHFPRTLLQLFQGTLDEKIRQLLCFLAPLTAGILRAV